jgi:hypothetical protein
MTNPDRPNRLVILCDGTWCGRETGTTTNISLLATALGIDQDAAVNDATPSPNSYVYPDGRKLNACYFPGAGLGGTFLTYMFNGATAGDIGTDCMEAYRYIVDNFDDKTEIWMFGHSRGSYTVRCVGGMINNCGIIKRQQTSDKTELLVEQVYRIYRSPYEEDAPSSDKSKKFRSKCSWAVERPIKFMGIIDTVGSLGIPQLSAGIGFDWPEFYDQNISSEVEKVYHAVSIHDRLWAFEPCRARRDPTAQLNPNLAIHEQWFPGCHYDVGRQKFKFFREGVNIVERLLFALPNHLTKPVMPNVVCADLVLLWMLNAIRDTDPNLLVLMTPDTDVANLEARLKSNNPDVGTGDAYSTPEDFTPAGAFGTAIYHASQLGVKAADFLTPNVHLGTAIQGFLGFKTILDILLATRDRRITDVDAVVTPLDQKLSVIDGRTLQDFAKLDRYASRTVEGWKEVVELVNGP